MCFHFLLIQLLLLLLFLGGGVYSIVEVLGIIGRSSRLQMFFKTGLLKSLKACKLQETPELVFSREYCENFEEQPSYRTPLVAASLSVV